MRTSRHAARSRRRARCRSPLRLRVSGTAATAAIDRVSHVPKAIVASASRRNA